MKKSQIKIFLETGCFLVLIISCVYSSFAYTASAPGCDNKSLNITTDKAVVLFTATWSGPDRKLMPVLDSIAKAYPDIPLHKIDVDKSPEVTQSCAIQAVPTLVTFSGGKRIDTHIGVGTEEKIEALFKKLKNL